ncbi:MAG: ABC transporter permease [Coprobacillaceae bacterium]
MIVFKNYLKVAKSFLGIIFIYTAIFLSLAVFTSASGSSNDTFEATEAKIAIVNNDEDTEFIKNFKEYVKDSAELVTLDNDEDALKDALFFRKVDYIMIIPENYTKDFIAGAEVKIDVMAVPDSSAAMYSKELMNKYLNTADLYVKADIDEDVLAEKVKEDLSKQVTVNLTTADSGGDLSSAKNFYNFANYTLLAITVVVVSMIMVSFNEDKIRRRNLISPVSYKSINRQLLLGNIVVSIGIWALYVGASFFLDTDVMLSEYGALFMLNSGVFMTTVLAIGFLLATITNNREVISGISNVIGLGSSFIAGAFVPQELLGTFVLFIAKFTPSYWYITNNNSIGKLTSFGFDSLQPILLNMGILLGFTVIFYIAIQLVGKFRLKK